MAGPKEGRMAKGMTALPRQRLLNKKHSAPKPLALNNVALKARILRLYSATSTEL